MEPQRGAIGTAVVGIVLFVLVVAAGATDYVITTTPHPSTASTSIEDSCSLLTPDMISELAWNGAGREVQGINQSTPPWNQPSIEAHIAEGWQTLCQSQPFESAIQAHGPQSFSSGGGFVNPDDVNASVVGISVGWSETGLANCTAYQEGWVIYIVNGTASGPSTTTASECATLGAAPS